MNSTSRDVSLLNEETRKIRTVQELIKMRQEQLLAAITGICNLMANSEMCCTFIHNFTVPVESLSVPDYYDIIKSHSAQRQTLLQEAKNLGDDWNLFSGTGGWFGGIWGGILGFFKKIFLVLVMIVLLIVMFYVIAKCCCIAASKVSHPTIATKPNDEEKALMAFSKNVWYRG